jgi:hypothetical protein
MDGEGLQCPDPTTTADTIAREVDGWAYFIHHVVDQIKWDGRPPEPSLVAEIVTKALTDPQDAWHLGHFRERIDQYYGVDEQPLALGLLDALAVADGPLSPPDLFNGLKARVITDDDEQVRRMVISLQRDHYIVQEPDGRYRFRFSIIQRSWRMQRGLV